MLLVYAFPNNPVVKWLTEFLPKIKGGNHCPEQCPITDYSRHFVC